MEWNVDEVLAAAPTSEFLLDEVIAANPVTPQRKLGDHVETFRSQFAKERPDGDAGEFLKNAIPFVGAGMDALSKHLDAKALQRINDQIQSGTIADESDDDYRVAGRAIAASEWAQQHDPTMFESIGSILAQLPAFAGEFAATAGAYTGAKGLASAGGRALLGRGAETAVGKLAMATVPRAAGVAAQTAANPQRIAQSAANVELQSALSGEDKSFLEALPEGIADTFIELGSERAGGKLIPKRLRDMVAATWIGRQAGRTPAALQSTLQRIGWNGVIGEIGEEHVGDIARSAIGLQSWEEALPTMGEEAAMAGAFAIPGVGFAAANRLMRGGAQPSTGAQPDTEAVPAQDAAETLPAAQQEVTQVPTTEVQDEPAQIAAEPSEVGQVQPEVGQQPREDGVGADESAEEETRAEPELKEYESVQAWVRDVAPDDLLEQRLLRKSLSDTHKLRLEVFEQREAAKKAARRAFGSPLLLAELESAGHDYTRIKGYDEYTERLVEEYPEFFNKKRDLSQQAWELAKEGKGQRPSRLDPKILREAAEGMGYHREHETEFDFGANLEAPTGSGAPSFATQIAPLDEIYKDMKRGVSAVRSLTKRFFTSAGHLPPAAFKAKQRSQAWTDSQIRQLEFARRDYRQAVRSVFGSQLRPEQAEIVNEVLGGGKSGRLPEPLRGPVRQMRDIVDSLSRLMIESGAAEGPVTLTIAKNEGVYLTRSFRVFDEPKWAESVDPRYRNRAKAQIRQEFPDATENQIEQSINELLYAGKAADTPMAVLKRSKLGSKDLSVLMQRKDLPEWLRQLWGEYKDPEVNFARSVTKMANLIGNHQFLTDVRKEGLGSFLWEKDDPNIDPEAKALISSEGSTAMRPLDGLRTYPEIQKAFEDVLNKPEAPWLARKYMQINGFAKLAKTGLSPVTQIRNFAANPMFDYIANGVSPSAIKQGFKSASPGLEILLGPRTKAGRAEFQRLVALGVVDESATAGELRDALRESMDLNPDQFSDKTLERWQGKGLKAVTDLYQWEDSVHKAIGFYGIRDQYRKALPELSDAELDRRVADIVRDIYPTYSMVPKATSVLSRFPLMGTFVRFPSEVIRTQFKTWKLVQGELADPKLRSIGARRAARLATVYALPYMATALSRYLTGVSPDDEEDMRNFVPPWSRNSDFIWLDKDTYIDLSYSDPINYLRKPIRALMRGASDEDALTALGESIGQLIEPFVGEEILAGKLLDIARNTTKDGRPVYNPEADIGVRAKSVTEHIWKALEPGAITSAKRIQKGFAGTVEPTGRSYDPATEIKALITGTRVQKVDVRQSLQFMAKGFQESMTKAGNIFTSTALNRGTVTPEEVSESYASAEKSRRGVFDDMHKKVSAAIRLGVSTAEAYDILDANGLSKDVAEALIAGDYMPYEASKQTIGRMEAMPGGPERVDAYFKLLDQRAQQPAAQSNGR